MCVLGKQGWGGVYFASNLYDSLPAVSSTHITEQYLVLIFSKIDGVKIIMCAHVSQNCRTVKLSVR